MVKMEYIIVYWMDQNRYSTLPISKLPIYRSSICLAKSEIVGKCFDFKWTDGHLYNGEVKNLGMTILFINYVLLSVDSVQFSVKA